MTTLSKQLLPPGSTDVLAKSIIDSVIEGEADPLDVWIELKRLESMIKKIREATKDAAFEELLKYGKGTTKNGIDLKIYNGRRIYSYDHNPTWQEADEQKKKIEEMMKSAAKYPVFDEETGEQVPPAKITYSSDTIAITL